MTAATVTGEIRKTVEVGFELKSVSTEVERDGQTGVYLEGYMAFFPKKDRGGDNWTLDLRAGSTSRRAIEAYFSKNPALLFEHGKDPTVFRKMLGSTVEYRVDVNGIWVRDWVPRPAENSPLFDIYLKIKAGIYKAFSIAGRWVKNARSTIIELEDIAEHSVVAIPMSPDTLFSLAKAFTADKSQVEQALALASQFQEKAGARISAATRQQIEEAISCLQMLLGSTNTGDSGTSGTSEVENEDGEALVEVELEITQGKSAVELRAALDTLKGVLEMADKEKGAAAATETTTTTASAASAVGTVTISAEKWADVEKMLAERAAQAIELEAERRAKEKLELEAKAAEDAAKAAKAEEDRINALVDQKMAAMRSGNRLTYSPERAGDIYSGGKAPAHINNRGEPEFRLTEFAAWSAMGKSYDYMQKFQARSGEKASAQQESIGSLGGFLVPEQYSNQVIPLARAKAVVRALGATVLPMASDVLNAPREISDVTTYWGAEGATLTDSNRTFAQLSFTAKKLHALVKVTREQMEDSNPSIEKLLRESMAAAIALAEDLAFLTGTGNNNQPLGVITALIGKSNSVTYVTGAVSANPQHTNLTRAAGIVRSNNWTPNGWVMHSRSNTSLLNVKDTAGQPTFRNVVGGYDWSQQRSAMLDQSNSSDPTSVQFGELLGYRQALSNQLTVSAATGGTAPAVVGDWSKYYIAERAGLRIEMDTSIGFTQDIVYIKATLRLDGQPGVPEAFCVVNQFPAEDVA